MEISSEQQRKTQYRSLLKYTGLFGSVQGLNLLSTLVRNKLSALLLGPGGLGIISLFMSVINMMNNATNLGIGFSGVRQLSQVAHEGRNEDTAACVEMIRCWGIITSLLGGTLCFAMAPWLSEWTFDSTEYTLAMRCVSLVIAFTALTGAELAILKGMRRLREVAASTMIATFLSLFVVIPLYYFFREAAIVPAMVGIAALTYLFTAYYSFRLFPFRRTVFALRHLKGGVPLVRLGMSMVLAGTFGAIAEYLIRTFIMDGGSLEEVGCYNAGVVMCVSYMGLIFVAIDNDYFSKLSAIHRDRRALNELVNQQIELSVMLIAPMIAGLLVFLPIAIELLYSSRFLAAMAMIEWAALFVFLKGVNLPLAYIALAKGDSRFYLVVELIFHLIYITMGYFGYRYAGLAGIGMAMSGSALCEATILSGCAYKRYHFRFSKNLVQACALYLPLLLATFGLTAIEEGWSYWISGVLLIGGCSGISLYLLNKRTDMLQTILRKLKS